jgi:hypothetical protein
MVIRGNVSQRESGCVHHGADLGEVSAPLEERWVKVESSLILLSKRVGEICNKQQQLFTRAVFVTEPPLKGSVVRINLSDSR